MLAVANSWGSDIPSGYHVAAAIKTRQTDLLKSLEHFENLLLRADQGVCLSRPQTSGKTINGLIEVFAILRRHIKTYMVFEYEYLFPLLEHNDSYTALGELGESRHAIQKLLQCMHKLASGAKSAGFSVYGWDEFVDSGIRLVKATVSQFYLEEKEFVDVPNA